MERETPTILCYEAQSGKSWAFFCDHCQATHFHGPIAGHRQAHCLSPNSPYANTGYFLELKPEQTAKAA